MATLSQFRHIRSVRERTASAIRNAALAILACDLGALLVSAAQGDRTAAIACQLPALLMIVAMYVTLKGFPETTFATDGQCCDMRGIARYSAVLCCSFTVIALLLAGVA